jgi:RNA polymerase sigma factor (sigma-70 family)
VTTQQPRERAWLETVFAAHHQHVLAYALRRVPAHDAEDVLAEVFATAWQHRQRVPDPALPWLYRAASHHVLHAQRGHGRRQRLNARLVAEPSAAERDHADTVAAQLDDASAVERALSALSPRDAEVLRLSAWEELSSDEIAYVLGCTTAAAKVRLHRARRRFAAALESSESNLFAAVKEATA